MESIKKISESPLHIVMLIPLVYVTILRGKELKEYLYGFSGDIFLVRMIFLKMLRRRTKWIFLYYY